MGSMLSVYHGIYSPSVDLYVGTIIITVLGMRTLNLREVTNLLRVTDTICIARKQCCGLLVHLFCC